MSHPRINASKFSESQLDAMQTRLLSSLKQFSAAPSNTYPLNDAIAVLADLREKMTTIVHDGAFYVQWARHWIPLFKDILVDVNINAGDVKKKKKDDDKKKDSREDASKTPPNKKTHPHFVAPNPQVNSVQHGIRRAILDIMKRCLFNDGFSPYAPMVLTCCVNVLLIDFEENALLATSLIFQLHKTYRMVAAPYSSNATSISRMKGEEARQLRECQIFLDFVCDCYRELNKGGGSSSLQKNFDFSVLNHGANVGDLSTPMSTGDSTTTRENMPSLQSKQSFRVLTECPLTVMLLFQLYPKFLKTNIPVMIPLMMDSLKLVPPRFIDPSKAEGTPAKQGSTGGILSLSTTPVTPLTGKATKEASKGETPLQPPDKTTTPMASISVPSLSKETLLRLYRIRAHELIAAQVKTLSFLTYLLRGFTDQMKPYEDVMAHNVVCLLKHCPREALSTRKELLVATRHILATDFRRGFFKHVDVLMDERVIAGNSRYSTVEQSLRPLSYSTLADLIHHARTRLTPAQLGRAVRIFSRVLHDVGMNMPLSMQMTAVRLLLHLVDQIFNNNDPNPQLGRDLLVRILTTFIQKFQTIKERIPGILESAEKETPTWNERLRAGSISVDKGANCKDEEETTHDDVSNNHSPTSYLRDTQSLLRSLFQGMKTVIWCINSYSQQREKERQRAIESGDEIFPLPPSTNKENDELNSALLKITNGERELLMEYIVNGIPCLRAFSFCLEAGKIIPRPPQYQDMVEAFVASFTVLESFSIRRTILLNLPFIMGEMDTDGDLIIMFKFLLFDHGKSVSYELCDFMFTYLAENIKDLADLQTQDVEPQQQTQEENDYDNDRIKYKLTNSRAQNTFKLFMSIFSSLTKYPQNEAALLPHLRSFVPECIRHSMELSTIGPGPYLCILRILFRTLTGGKFEASYKEMAPLLPTILNGFYRIYLSTDNEPLRFMIVELMLTIPSRLSVLLPHLPLLVKILIPALQSNRGDLVNLALRNLEFWVDNLHSDYIYPVIAQQSDTLCNLMISLTKHLQPAPYPYGLLCLRLLGKLGGKNRLFLHEIMCQDFPNDNKMSKPGLSILFEWQGNSPESAFTSDEVSLSFPLRLPLERAVDVLRFVRNSPRIVAKRDELDTMAIRLPLDDHNAYFKCLFGERSERLDLNAYAVELMEQTKTEQASSAFAIIRGALASILDFPVNENFKTFVPTSNAPKSDEVENSEKDTNDFRLRSICTSALKLICDGLFTSTAIEELHKEAMVMLKGFGSHIFFLLSSHISCVTRIDSDGAAVDNVHQVGFAQNHLGGKLQPLKPFGCFRLSGTLGKDVDPFVLNESLVDALACSDSKHIVNAANEVLSSTIELAQNLMSTADRAEKIGTEDDSLSVGDVVIENLLSCMCQACFGQSWNCRIGVMNGILQVLSKMGQQWSKSYEVEILHVSMFLVKDAPPEIALANKESLRFFVTITWFYFGGPTSWDSSTLIYDVLSTKSTYTPIAPEQDAEPPFISQASLTLILSEIGSTKHFVRFAVRHFLRIVTHDKPSIEFAVKENVTALKRLIFPRILRSSPLPEQVAIVEAIAFMIERAPLLFSIDDQTVLAFTAELLKMVSVADGDISDTFTSVVLIDKHGFAVNTESPSQPHHGMHTSSVFLNKSFKLQSDSFGGCVIVPEELPLGVQFRVASIYLFRGLIRRFPDHFFDAEPKTQIGNLRPHVVSLLFRSLTAQPSEVVAAGESALHDALLLGASEKEDSSEDQPKSSHRLPKELIQTCIRPILINLRDHTKLTIPLLRGIARLLSLLSSWFNKALGEKMIEHLSKFTEADKITSLQLWNLGDEPKVAAAVMDLFALLPQASRFVEALVKSTLRLEAAWCLPVSPFRDPLARYLNRHCASAAGFFLEEHRLCNPMYSELFGDILQRKSSEALREYISGKECTVMLLNVCFERPLAIIRSEKNASSPVSKASTAAHLLVYGVNPLNSYSTQRKLEIARQDITSKKNQLDEKNQEEASLKAAKSKSEDVTNTHLAVERLKRELETSRTAYAQEILQASSQKEVLTERPMTTTALELQHQGFKVIEILMKYNRSHIQNDVLRALRWLWRSRGRHYRLLYEEEIQPRYFMESYTLAKFLIAYSKANPADIDVLFDLIRVFLNPSSIDFTFVQQFLYRRVAYDLSLGQREQVLQRYLTLLSSEGSEENKIVSTTLLVYPMLKHIAQANDPRAAKTVISHESIKIFTEVILHVGLHSTKLTCQFLRLIDVLLEFMPNDVVDFRKDLIKYIWGVLKSDDASTKYYGYLAVSRFVAAFETPPKVTLQVFRSLLRSHSTPEIRMVRDSLNILVPALPSRLSSDELDVALKYTIKVIHEEGNSVQHLAHLLECITSHPHIFSAHSSCLIPYMVHSISTLGVSLNSPPEHKELSVAVAKLVFEWGKTNHSFGSDAKVDTKTDSNNLDPNILDAIVNFAVKIILSNAETKVDLSHRQIHFQATSLLRDVLSSHPNANISAIHFERVFSLGSGEGERELLLAKKHQEKSGDVLKKSEKLKKSSNEDATLKKRDHVDSTYPSLIVASVEIFSILLSHKPSSTLISLNACKMLSACFSHKVSIKDDKGAGLLKEFVVNLVAAASLGSNKASIISLLEHSIEGDTCRNSSDSEACDQINHKAYLAIDIIEEVCVTCPDFVEPFISCLITFSKQQVKDHIKEIPRNATSMVAGGTNNLPPATSTLGIFELACGIGFHAAYRGTDITAGYESNETQTLLEIEHLKPSLRALVKSLRLISSSSVLFTFSTARKLFLEAISLILDSSVCIPLLMATVGIIGNNVMRSTQGAPFTRNEQEECLWRIAQIDFNKLPLAASHALNDMICLIVLSKFGYNPSLDRDYPFECNTCSPESSSATYIKPSNDSTENVLDKLFAICLMSGNLAVRSIAVSIFAKDIRDSTVAYQRLASLAVKMHCLNGEHIDVVGVEVIRLFLNCDLECLGKRLWTVLLMDLLLAVGKLGKGLCLTSRWQRCHTSDNKNINEGFLKLTTKPASECERKLDVMAEEIYSAFIKLILSEKSEQQCGGGRCISAIRIIAYGDVDTSQSILECCFQAAWQHLPTDEDRSALIQRLEKLLAMPYNAQFLKTSQCTPMNTVQSLVRLLIHLRPMPTIDTFLLSSLASDFGLHNEVFVYLERKYLALTRQSFETSSESFLLLQAIHKCLSRVGDRDVVLATFSTMCSIAGTKLALSLDTYGFVKKATDAYVSLIERASENCEFMPSEFEFKLWEQQWVEVHKELSQWSLIDELTSTLGDKNVMIECAWKTKSWDKVKSLCGSPTIIASIEQGDSLAKMTEIFLAIHEGKLAEVENLHAQAAQLCLYKWQLLPAVGSGSTAHNDLFQQFQRLVELRESSQIMIETFSHSSRRSIPDLKAVLSSWRHRSPNPFEPVSVWEDLYFWRFHIFDAVAKNFSWAEAGTLAALHDRPYAAITLGRTARKQDLKEVSMFLLSHLTDCMDVEDAFLKLREQIVSYRVSPEEAPEEAMLKGGLNLVNSTNLTFFNSRQKAELFRLKSYFFNALNDKSNAHKNYCYAVQLSPNYARAWIDWGHLCASLCDSSKINADSKDPKHKMNIQYLAQAMGCYLEAIRCDASEQSRETLPHCLSMLSLDSPQFGYLCKAFEARAPLLPAWVWLPWIPQLLTCLYRAEAHSAKAVLIKIANDHPQALYYSLRAFFLERRDIERSKDHDVGSKQEDDAQKHAEVLMSNLRKSHPVLWSKLEAILEDLIIRFRPSYEAELLATIKALLDKARTKAEPKASCKDTAPDSKVDLLEYLLVSLSKISLKFFNKEKPDSSKGRKTLLFEKKWHALFDRDFLEKHSELNAVQGRDSIDELIEKLEVWKAKLEHEVALVPNKCYLQETSPSLSWYSGQSSDYWAGSCESVSLMLSNSQHDYHSTLDNTLYEATRSSALAAYKASSDAVLSSAKSEGLGGHEGGGSSLIEIPGQYAPTSSSILDLRPFPELHAKLVNFHQTLEVISSPSKQDQTVRQISMIGSDGRNYKFLLQLAIPYWTRTDERSAQLQYIMGKIMRNNIQTCRRCLPVRPNVVIPVAQRMRMTANEPSYHSLDSAFHHVQGGNLDHLVAVFEEEVSKRLAIAEDANGDNQPHLVEHVKNDVYRHICHELVLPDILSKYMTVTIPSIERMVQFRKMFASQLSSNSVIQHTFAVIERTPMRFVFCNRTGKVLAQDFRFQYNQGLLEAPDVPFRMTRSIAELIGPFLLEGIFLPSFVCISSAMNTNRNALEPVFHLLLRDDIISWYTSKTLPRNDKKLQEMEQQLSDRVRKNIGYVQERLKECSPRLVENAAEEVVSRNPQPIDAHVRNLLDAATNEQKLCMMSPSYHAWL